MQGLDVGLLGTLPADPLARPEPTARRGEGDAPPPPPPTRPRRSSPRPATSACAHLTRRGDRVRAWYRGPLAPHPTTRDAPDADGRLPLAHASDQLRRIVPDGREDLSLAGRVRDRPAARALAALDRARADALARASSSAPNGARRLAERALERLRRRSKPRSTARPSADLGRSSAATCIVARGRRRPTTVLGPAARSSIPAGRCRSRGRRPRQAHRRGLRLRPSTPGAQSCVDTRLGRWLRRSRAVAVVPTRRPTARVPTAGASRAAAGLDRRRCRQHRPADAIGRAQGRRSGARRTRASATRSTS